MDQGFKWLFRSVLSAVLFSLVVSFPALAKAETVKVAVASNFKTTAEALVRAYSLKSGHEVVLSSGSTGKLYTQIKNGAPFEVFLAADSLRAALSEKNGLAVAGSRFTYARGRIALWSNRADLAGLGPDYLKGDKVTRLAIANPKTAPYGQAAVEMLKNLRLYEAVKHKIVQGENIAQTYQFVYSGNAEVGVVALSQIVSQALQQQKTVATQNSEIGGVSWVVPEHLYQPIDQQAVLLIKGQGNPAATAFVAYLKSDEAAAIIQSFGYATVKP
ncbi:molybdate ABC transporter substrate-binding protein [Kiloniella laminariae]|uniref:Molybdate ABC transporter substrate-binding protein n=1 Tax=Kiloniella laminariae TaxID=454162 RepID=A0ABT4LE37_9PROT|nr:molybdate ABC transporter substrate-binding protein [Kiloniella laminariae]MCZ4279359.1 molybdate ABC transporter substrate-binding protein [Kiloniella laminariae]